MDRFRVNKVRFWLISFVLVASQGLSAQKDTTFVLMEIQSSNINIRLILVRWCMMVRCIFMPDMMNVRHPAEHYLLNDWCVFSSSDMKTWTEHPVPLKAKDFSWAKGEAWASQVIERNGKFYWYVTVEHKDVPGKSIGVAVADSPLGPFIDARGSALITNDMTTERTKIYWDDIDPTVFIDDDGQAYLYWGNTQCYYARLKKNMIELGWPSCLL